MGSGGRTEDGGQILGSGSGLDWTAADAGRRTMSTQASHWQRRRRDASQDGGYLIGGGRGGYFGSGLSVRQLRLLDGSSLLVVSSDEGMFVIPIEE